MGRHSAADDEDEGHSPVLVVFPPLRAVEGGRHARDEDAEAPTQSLPVVAPTADEVPVEAAAETTEPLAIIGPLADDEPFDGVADAPPAGAVDAPVEGVAGTLPEAVVQAPSGGAARTSAPPRGTHSTAADLALMRRRPDVRNRVIAAVIVPFVLYIAAMVLIGAAAGQYLLWVWIPLVSAGVGGGLILDTAHRKDPPGGDA